MSPSSPEPEPEPALALPPALSSLWRSMRLGFRLQPLLLVVSGVATIAAALPDALFAVGFAWFTGALAAGDRGRLFTYAAVLACLAAGTWLLQLASDRANLRLAERASVPLETHVARLQSSIVTIEHQERPGYLDMLELLRDHGGTLGQLYRSVFSAAGAVVRLLLTVSLLMSVRPWLGLLALCAVPGVVVTARRAPAEKRAEVAGAADRRLARQMFVLGTTAASAKELRVSGTQGLVRRLRATAWERQYRALARERWISALGAAGSWAVFGAAFVACVVFVALAQGPRATVVSAVVLVVAAGTRLSQYVGQTVSETQFLRGIWLDAARRLAWLEDYAASQVRAAGPPVPERLRAGIRLEHVSFRYAGSGRPVLEDVSLALPAGSVVAIVGENGAGKSTLVKLLCRFYDPSSGRVTVDGADLSRLDPARWRERLAGTFQDFFRFEYRAALAIGLGDLPRAGDREAISRAVARAGAGAVIAGLGDGLGTQLGGTWHEGAELSFGQWQRIALARGFMRDDPLLLVLDGARVRETGSHAELMALNGTYAELYRIQAAAYR